MCRYNFALLLCMVLVMAACAGQPKRSGQIKGIYHQVKKDETLWRIACSYGTDVPTLVAANNLSDPDIIEEGSALFIPCADALVSIPSVSVSRPPKETAVGKEAPDRKAEAVSHSPPPVVVQKTDPRSSTVTISKNTETKNQPQPPPLKSQSGPNRFIWPVKGKISSRFGLQPNGMRLTGIKIESQANIPVHASAEGTVIHSDPVKYYGETIIIKHRNHYSTVYAHLEERRVKTGDIVRKGQQIGTLGHYKGNDKCCLHFEIRYKNKAKNPLRFLGAKDNQSSPGSTFLVKNK